MAPDAPELRQDDNNPEASMLSQQGDAGQAALGRATIGDTPGGAVLRNFMQQRQDAMQQAPDLNQSQQNMENANKAAVVTKAQHLRNIGQNALRAAGTMLSHLGDVGAIGKVPEGAGGLYGAARTLGARQQRGMEEQKMQQEQQKNSALIAEANMRTRMTEETLHRMDEEDRDRSLQKYGVAMDMMRKAGFPVTLENAHSGQLTKGLQNKSINPAQHIAVPDGKTDNGKDADGNDITRGTYSVVVPQDITIDEKKPEQMEFLNWINKYAPPAPGKQWQPGQTFNKEQLSQILSAAAQGQMLETAVDKMRQANDLDKYQKGEQIESYESRRIVNQALLEHVKSKGGGLLDGEAIGDAFQALASVKNPDGSMKYPDVVKDMIGAVGEDAWKAFTKTSQGKLAGTLDDMEKKMDGVSNTNEIAGMVADLQTLQKDPIAMGQPAQLTRVNSLLGRAIAKKAAMETEEQDKFNAEQRAKDGDVDLAGRQLANHELTLSELKTRGVSAAFIENVQNAAKKYDPNYSAAVTEQQAKIAGNETNTQFFGNVASMIGRGGTLDQLVLNANQISDHDFQILNKIQNWTKEEIGKAGVSAYAATAVGLADDYAKVMGGSVGSDTARAMVLKLIDRSLSPQQRQAAVDAMRDSVRSQAEGRMGDNPFMRRQYGPMIGITGPRQAAPNLPPGVITRLQQTPGKPVNFGPKGYWTWVNGRAIQTDANGRAIAGQ